SGNTLKGAIAEAAFLTGVERNSDVVVMASYAPLFARIGYTQWAPDLIWFDDAESYGSPSYHVQRMYSLNTGDYTLKTEGSFDKDLVFTSASYDTKAKELILKVVNASDKKKRLSLDLKDFKSIKNGKVTAETLTGDGPDAFNTIEDKTRVSTVKKEIKDINAITLPALSFTVYRIPCGR
ncbi:MAG: alpha-L-arabinofuranosidase, partial [Lachnospiraceae bacterium]|nr:alpha-L-arabinofuranosidase [Lachnospiraceae bacterium]